MILSDALILPVSQLQTASDDVTYYVTYRIFNTDLSYFYHFVVEIDEKSSLTGGF